MRLDRENGRCLGVCAGLANWLDVPACLVRIVFVICVIAWPPMLLGYFILWFCLDKDISPEKVQGYFSNAKTAEHFRRLDYRKPIYRNERDKKIAGVCAGIADYLEVSSFMVRLVTLGSLFILGPFTFWAYVICWVVFDPDPYLEDSDRLTRREQKRQRREARHARRAARRKTRKSYVNKEFDAADIELEVEDTARDFESDLKEDLKGAMGRFADSVNSRRGQVKAPRYTRAEVTSLYASLEGRLREIEAFMTSKKFHLHCQINRI